MSPRAAWRLERLGYTVLDYTAGKADWLAAGLRTVRAEPSQPRAIDAIERDVATCAPDALITELDAQVSLYAVVNELRIVLGRIRMEDLERAAPEATAEQVMEPGPATIRADADLEQTRKRLRDRRVPNILVTTPEGRTPRSSRGDRRRVRSEDAAGSRRWVWPRFLARRGRPRVSVEHSNVLRDGLATLPARFLRAGLRSSLTISV